MQGPLYKLYGKKTANVEVISGGIAAFETSYPQYAESPYKLVSSDALIGIEIEVENINPDIPITSYPLWNIKNDNSLREGYEYVSVPMKGNRILYALNYFYDVLPTSASFSPRTSVHIHMNVLDFTPEQIGNLLMAYAVAEKLLYKWVGHERDKNNFAVPMYDTHHVSYFLRSAFANPYNGFVGMTEHTRYLGCNLDSVKKLGSMEFRHMHGTRNKKKLVQWINFLFYLREFALTNNPREVQERVCKLNTESNYYAFLSDIFKDSLNLLDTSNLQQDMEEIVTEIKRGICPNPFFRALVDSYAYKETLWWKALKTKKGKTDDMMYIIGAERPRPQGRRAGRPNPLHAFNAQAQAVPANIREDEEVEQFLVGLPRGQF